MPLALNSRDAILGLHLDLACPGCVPAPSPVVTCCSATCLSSCRSAYSVEGALLSPDVGGAEARSSRHWGSEAVVLVGAEGGVAIVAGPA